MVAFLRETDTSFVAVRSCSLGRYTNDNPYVPVNIRPNGYALDNKYTSSTIVVSSAKASKCIVNISRYGKCLGHSAATWQRFTRWCDRLKKFSILPNAPVAWWKALTALAPKVNRIISWGDMVLTAAMWGQDHIYSQAKLKSHIEKSPACSSSREGTRIIVHGIRCTVCGIGRNTAEQGFQSKRIRTVIRVRFD